MKFNKPFEILNRNRPSRVDLHELVGQVFQTKTFFVHTCTAALEVAAMALNLKAEDEVIMPSYTFVATANAFARTGCKIVFVDVDETMNMDLDSLESTLTSKTRVVVPVHYGGLSCDMDRLMVLSRTHNFLVVEDAAQAIGARYNGQLLGTIGHLACMSFHETKNIQCGEGGLLLVNDEALLDYVELILNHGTNRMAFQRQEVDRYTWQCIGGAFLMDVYRKRILVDQFEYLDQVTEKRRELFFRYHSRLGQYPMPTYSETNGHLFFIKCKSPEERSDLMAYLKSFDIEAFSHYEPLHLSGPGRVYRHTVMTHTLDAQRLLRLPLYYDLSFEEQAFIIERIEAYYG